MPASGTGRSGAARGEGLVRLDGIRATRPFAVDTASVAYYQRASALETVRQTPGVTDARLVEPPTEQNVQVTVDLAKAEALGMTPGDVRRQAATLVGGLEVGAIFEQQKVFDVQVWTPRFEGLDRKAHAAVVDEQVGEADVGVDEAEAPDGMTEEDAVTLREVGEPMRGKPVSGSSGLVRSK